MSNNQRAIDTAFFRTTKFKQPDILQSGFVRSENQKPFQSILYMICSPTWN